MTGEAPERLRPAERQGGAPRGCKTAAGGEEVEGVKMTTTEQGETAIDGQSAAIGLAGGFYRLTPTQLKVLEGVNSGLLNKQIAFDLGIAEATVKAHMTALMRKLNVRNRTQVAIAAQSMGWAAQSHHPMRPTPRLASPA